MQRIRHNDHWHEIETLDEDGDEIATVDGRYVRDGFLARRYDGTLVAFLPYGTCDYDRDGNG